MVCLGNICRSPLAEGLLKKKIDANALDWTVDSCGTADYHVGSAPDKRIIKIAASFHTDISNLRARQFSVSDFEKFDLIYAMDKNNYRNIIELAKNNGQRNKVHLLLNEWKFGQNLEVPDPYYGSEQDFINVFKLLDEALDSLLNNRNVKK